MKTDLVEIFQTIRASAQPYAALGFAADVNSETEYILNTEKRLDNASEDAFFFAGISIKKNYVEFCLFPQDGKEKIQVAFKPMLSALLDNGCFKIAKLDDDQVTNIEEALSEGYKIYKEKGWV